MAIKLLGNLSAATVLAFALSGLASPSAVAQSKPTADRVGDLQIGGSLAYARSGYNFTPIHLIGEGLYTTFDWKTHLGAEFNFHNTTASQDSTVYERTYEVGPRVYLTRGRFVPYAKVMYGRGVYNFHNSVANVAYNMYTYGGGADFRVLRSINVRADYEYQNWMSFPLGTLHPSVFMVGVAYHFHE
jgi:opacity protein-like surface antigen